MFLGLDISSTSTGAVLLAPDHDDVVWQGTWQPPTELDYIDRGSWQAEKMIALVEQFDLAGIAIENYSLGSINRAVPLITVGTVLRYFLRQMGHGWQEVAPTQVKKYACAKLKEDLKVEVFKRWGFEHRSNDVIDAYVLARIARALAVHDGSLIRPQQEVLQALLNPKAKRKKAKEAV